MYVCESECVCVCACTRIRRRCDRKQRVNLFSVHKIRKQGAHAIHIYNTFAHIHVTFQKWRDIMCLHLLYIYFPLYMYILYIFHSALWQKSKMFKLMAQICGLVIFHRVMLTLAKDGCFFFVVLLLLCVYKCLLYVYCIIKMHRPTRIYIKTAHDGRTQYNDSLYM